MVAVSNSIKNYLQLGIKLKNIHLIPNGLIYKELTNLKKRIHSNNEIYLSLGRYHPKKF